MKLRTPGEGPVNEALVEFAGTEVYNLEIIPAGDATVTAGDTGFAEGAGAGAEVVGTGVCVTRGLSGSTHPAIAIIKDEKTDQENTGIFHSVSSSVST